MMMKQAQKNSVFSFAALGDPESQSAKGDLEALARRIEKYAPHDGRFELPVPGIHVVKYSAPDRLSTRAVSTTGMCIAPQGAKRVTLGQDIYEYDESRMVVYSSEVPVAASVIRASKEEPYLGMVIEFDQERLSELVLKAFPHGVPKRPDFRPIYIGKSNPKIVTSAIRLLDIVSQQEDVDLLIPLAIDEILIRLLRSPIGSSIAQIGIRDSNAHKVSRAIAWLKENFATNLNVEELAQLVGMSPSSFYQHFKSITSMSPLQYQKVLRLQEARQLMLSRMMDVSTTSMQVGYASSSQFSREYSRFFGNSPSKDLEILRLNSAS